MRALLVYSQPSDKDIETNQQLVAAGILLGIRLSDHIILTRTDQYSLREHNLVY